MAVPDYQSLMRPLLEAVQDGTTHVMREVAGHVAATLGLSDSDLQELLPSGKQTIYKNRIGWAKTYLTKAQALATETRGTVKITTRGQELLARTPGRIVQRDLEIYPEFLAFKTTGQSQTAPAAPTPDDISLVTSPEEQLATLYSQLLTSLADELLSQVMQISPQQFERLVVEVLVSMGYGGSVRDAGQALGRSGDNGIDGMIKQDPLGLDRVYLQAKKWQNTVHSPEIRTFAGSLTYHRASKGVFLTTSGFSEGAKQTAAQIGNIILIDGHMLASLMIDYSVGVLTRKTYSIRRVDSEYFEEL
ncbi:restriction endonuclease [Deinococcus sp. QL22]|uniref:restriction endonuclease n=1 Tax=Deinococcus sp. QL22 TaxID=2939437 RepID=UPI002016F4FC|nr:restriction endonuclease [Deinococcus sp. QL22]UQN05923.1 restriction endonuclease [Deinococcus sp. QL22]